MDEAPQPFVQVPANPLAQTFNVFSLLKFAFPSIFMMLFMGLYTIIDTVFVARFSDTYALPAINIVVPVLSLVVGLGSMLAAGGSASIAREMGRQDTGNARRIFMLVILAGLTAGILIGILGLTFLEPLLRALGASRLLLPYCRDYLTILLIFAPANILQILFQNLLITAGKPGLGFWLVFAAGLTNILFDFLLIVPLQMGIRGAAIATGLGYLVPVAVGAHFFLHNRNGSFYFCRPSLNIRILGQICFNGSSELVGQLSAAVTTFLFNLTMMRLLGEDGVAAITIIIYSQFLLSTLYIGFSMGVAPVISYRYGGGMHRQLRHVFQICLVFIGIVSFLVFGLSFAGGPTLAGLFSPINSRIYGIARFGFYIFPFSFLFCGFNIFASALFTALSNGKVSALLSFLRTFGFLTFALLTLPLYFEETGVWLAVPIAELLTFFLSAFFIWRYRNRYQYL